MPDLKSKEPDLVKLLDGADADKKLEGLRIAYGPRNKRAWATVIASVTGLLWAGYYMYRTLP